MVLVATESVVLMMTDGRAVQFAPGDEVDGDRVRKLDEKLELGVVAEIDRPEPVESDGDDGGGEDLTAGTVEDVLARVLDNPDSAQAVLDAELAGDNRKGVVDNVRAMLGLKN